MRGAEIERIGMTSSTDTAGAANFPSLAKEGWRRHQVNGPLPLKGAAGVVRSTSDNRWLERTTPSAPAKEASPLFLNGRSHPSFAKEGSSPALTVSSAYKGQLN